MSKAENRSEFQFTSSPFPLYGPNQKPSIQRAWTVRKFRSKLLQARPFLIIFIASLNLLCCAISSDLINSLQRVCHVQSLTDVWFQAFWSQSSGPFPSMHRPSALQSYALLSFKKDLILMMPYCWEICCILLGPGLFCLHPLAMCLLFLLICLVFFCRDVLYTRIALSCGEYLLASSIYQGLQYPIGIRL